MAPPGKRRAKVRRGYLPAESEAAFAQKADQLAGYCGWTLTYHTFNSARSQPGFPDRVYVRVPRLLFVEFKAENAAPRVKVAERPLVAERPAWLQDLAVTHEQAAWLEALRAVGDAIALAVDYTIYETKPSPGVEVYLWRPSDWPEIERVLK